MAGHSNMSNCGLLMHNITEYILGPVEYMVPQGPSIDNVVFLF